AQDRAKAPARADMTAPLPAAAFQNLQALADRYVAEKKSANMVIGIAQGDAPATWIEVGNLALEGATPAADAQSIYRIYSMTKPVVGVATALLIDEGKLALDQPVSDVFPAFAEMRVVKDRNGDIADTVPATTPITIRHLLTHTAGLTYGFNGNKVSSAYRKAGILPGQRRLGGLPGDGAQPNSLDEFAARIAALPLVAEPGTEWHYSVSLDLMGAVIEKVTGEDLGSFLEARIFLPLGMDDTGFVVPKEDNERLTTNYLIAGEMPLPFPLPVADGTLIAIDGPPNSEYNAPANYASGGGGLASTGEDYMRFMRMVANLGMVDGEQLFPLAALQLATSDLLPPGAAYDDVAGSARQGYGAGGRLITADAPGAILGSYGWGGAAGTLANATPRERMAVVLMTQYMPQQAYPLPKELGEAVAADLKAMTLKADMQVMGGNRSPRERLELPVDDAR
ncbi:MAG: serine hydrolase domain-containing protein, partial [Pacificimonas sp.]